MKCKGWQQLRANAKNGISMALVLCVSAFFIAFAAAILYTAGMLTAQSNQRLKEERCYQLAKSYSDVLKNELTKYDKKYTDDGSTVGDGTFYAFANKFLDDEKYLEYNSDYKDSTKYNFVEDGSNLSDISSSPLSDKGYGNISVTLKKEQNSDENVDEIMSGGEITGSSGGDYSSAIKNIENLGNQHEQLPDVVEVLPGLMPKILKQICKTSKVPVIAGGLISDKEDVMGALGAGAAAVSTTNQKVWEL